LTAPRIAENMGAPKMRPGGRAGSVRAESVRAGSVREGSLGVDGEEGLVGPPGWQQTGKSVWLGREGEVTVEGWVLEWWEAKGYKG
jgi:Fanconi-associated nuclease 1